MVAREATVAHGPQHARRSAGERGRRRGWALPVVGALVLVVLGCAAWLARDALVARGQLLAARADVAGLEKQASTADVSTTAATVASLQTHADSAARHTSGPLWTVSAHLPWVGPQVTAVRTVAEVVDSLARVALPPLVDVVKVVNPSTLAPEDGGLNLAPLQDVAPRVLAADDAVRAAQLRLAAVQTRSLLPQVAGPLAALRDEVDQVAGTVGTAARAAALLPAMLGADGPRNYLVLVQNNAEPRATGGIPGTVLHIRAESGHVQVVDDLSGGGLSGLASPALPLTDAEKALFGPQLGTDMRDVTFTPDFPRSAALAAAIWQQHGRAPVDGVISVDPGALAALLGATGPVKLANGSTLTADNAVAQLLNGVYLQIPNPAAQDAYFAATAASVLHAVVSGQGKPAAVMDALAKAAREGRLMVWSAHDEEQARLKGTVLSGELRGQSGSSGIIGVYLNDGTQAKMGYYLSLDVTGSATQCQADGSQVVNLTVALTSHAPADAVTLPDYITGAGSVVPRGTTRTNVLVYAPTGGGIDSVTVNSQRSGAFAQVQDGLPVVATTVDLTPGQTGTMVLRVRTGAHPGNVLLRLTPMANGPEIRTLASACSTTPLQSQVVFG